MAQETDFNISFRPTDGYGVDVKFIINGEEIEVWIVDVLNETGILDLLLRSLHHLSPLASGAEYAWDVIEYIDSDKFDHEGNLLSEGEEEKSASWCDIPKSANVIWASEGEWCEWKLECEPAIKETLDFDLQVTIEIGYKDKKTEEYLEKAFRFEISYRKMCEIVARACTDLLKKYGFYRYFSASKEDLSLRSLIFIKAIAMNRMDVRNLIRLDDEETCKSNFDEEIALLVEDF